MKVKGKNNVFFNVSTSNFSIDYNTAIPKVSWENEVLVFPVPAMNELTIKSNLSGALESVMVNPVGQVVWKGKVQNQETIRVRGWAKGVYYLQLVNGKGEKLVKPVSIQ
ncbi:MAG: T9SS type A sorting domain-containing protein [Sphingobacteriales bacterium]|nr:MAG: T9SS type A sorting domain-containing protein [Sphingobacteriales bacterium]